MLYNIVIRQYGKERIVRAWGYTLSEAIEKVSRVFYVNEEKTRRLNDA